MQTPDHSGRLFYILALIGIAVDFLPVGASIAKPPVIRAVAQKPYHCGPASAETILRFYKDRGPWMNQTTLAATLCARMPEYKTRHPEAKGAIERYYPDFKETFQPVLAELLIDHGYSVISTRTSVDGETGKPLPGAFQLLVEHLWQGHLAILHIPGHYIVASGVDREKETLYLVDPNMARKRFSTTFSDVQSGQGFHPNGAGELRPGWVGRSLIFWKGDKPNEKDHCLVCDKVFPGKYPYCRACGSFIDRRASNHVQRALDTIVMCTEKLRLTEVRLGQLKLKFGRLLKKEGFGEGDLKSALGHYPLASGDPERIETLHRTLSDNPVDVRAIPLSDLMVMVSSGEQWRRVVERSVASVGGRE